MKLEMNVDSANIRVEGQREDYIWKALEMRELCIAELELEKECREMRVRRYMGAR